MNVVFRADASLKIGAGHIMRCLTFADELKKNNYNITFICRELPVNLRRKIVEKGFNIHFLINQKEDNNDTILNSVPEHDRYNWEDDANETIKILGSRKVRLLVVDHYSLDYRWHIKLQKKTEKIFVIDDLANRRYSCDYLLDQTLNRSIKDYKRLVNINTKIFTGTKYALIRPEFKELRTKAIARRKDYSGIKRILVSVGGSDINNITIIILKVLQNYTWENIPEIDVVIGSSSACVNSVREIAIQSHIPINIHLDTDDMAKLMLNADLAIGALGTTSWERCALGLPALATVIADNQKMIASMLENAGAIKLWSNEDELEWHLISLLADTHIIRSMIDAASLICDGLGCHRLLKKIGYDKDKAR